MASESKMAIYPYTEEDVARGYTVEHGREGSTRQKPIPADVWVALALGRIADALEGRSDGSRAALRALVAIPPLRYYEARGYCHHCGAHLPDGNSGHADDCAWVRACELVAGQRDSEE